LLCEKNKNESLSVRTDGQTDTISACRLSTLPLQPPSVVIAAIMLLLRIKSSGALAHASLTPQPSSQNDECRCRLITCRAGNAAAPALHAPFLSAATRCRIEEKRKNRQKLSWFRDTATANLFRHLLWCPEQRPCFPHCSRRRSGRMCWASSSAQVLPARCILASTKTRRRWYYCCSHFCNAAAQTFYAEYFTAGGYQDGQADGQKPAARQRVSARGF
jgi:hypothetical protein